MRGPLGIFLAASLLLRTPPAVAIDLAPPFASEEDGGAAQAAAALGERARRELEGRGRRPAWTAPRPWITHDGENLVVDVARFNFSLETPRNQTMLGSCTAFAAIGLLEAAYMRSGKCVRLSEADAFLRYTVFGWPCWAAGDCRAELRNPNGEFCAFFGNCELRGTAAAWEPTIDQGGYVDYLIAHIKRRGVLTGDGYADFTRRFAQWMREGSIQDRVRLPGNAALTQLMSGLEDYRDGDLAAQQAIREMVRRDISGWQVRTLVIPRDETSSSEVSPQRCRLAGRRQAALIASELESGRPVAVTADLAGLKGWRRRPRLPEDMHNFLITGYRSRAGGLKTFMTRNSWGGKNPDVSEDGACHIAILHTVVRPEAGETSAF